MSNLENETQEEMTIEEKLVALGIEVRNMSLDTKRALQVCLTQQNIVETMIIDREKEAKKNAETTTKLLNEVPKRLQAGAAEAIAEAVNTAMKGFRENAELEKSATKTFRQEIREAISVIHSAGKEIKDFVKWRSLLLYISIIAVSIVCVFGVHFQYKQYSDELSIMRGERAKLGEYGVAVWLDPPTGIWIILPRGAKIDTSKPRIIDGRQAWKLER